MEFIQGLFDTSNWPARWSCGIWSPIDGWLYIISDLMTFSAYMAIPFILWYFLKNHKKETPFKGLIWLFVFFIFFCGLTHLADVIIFWYPFYRFSALLRLFTGIVSIVTAIMLFRKLPEALKFRSPKALEKIIKERTDELSKKENELSSLINNLPEVIIRVDKNYNILLANKAYFNLVDSDGNNLELTNLKHINMNRNQIDEYQFNIDKAFEQNKTQYFEQTVKKKHSRYYYYAKIIPERISDKKTALCITSDITEQKKKELELKQVLNEKENINRIIIHDVKSPIGTIQNLANLAIEDANEESIEIFSAIESTSKKANAVINDLLGLSMISGKIQKKKTNFAKFFNKIESNIPQLAKDKEIKINFSNSYNGNILIEPILITRAIENLITNAIKFSYRNGEIFVRAKQIDNTLQIQIIDKGIGIPKNLISKVLDKRTIASRHGTEGEATTGIGLYLVAQIIKKHNGEILIDSEEGKGSTFSLQLPL